MPPTLAASLASSPTRSQAWGVQKFVFPGGGLTVQPGFKMITTSLLQINPYVLHEKSTVLVFNGSLSNVHELQTRFSKPTVDGHSLLDVPTATTKVLLQMYKKLGGPGHEVLLLSELQGQYAFVLYDADRKHVFAARDPTGSVPLYMHLNDEGSVAFASNLDELPDGENVHEWSELLPGHYVAGKRPQVHQFALTPEQLRDRSERERQESLELGRYEELLASAG